MDNPWMIAVPAPVLLVLVLSVIVLLIFAEQQRREVRQIQKDLDLELEHQVKAVKQASYESFLNGVRYEHGVLYKAASKAAHEQRDILSALREAGTPVLN